MLELALLNAAIVGLTLLDLYVTKKAINKMGAIAELNPLNRKLFEKLPFLAAAIVILAGHGVVLGVIDAAGIEQLLYVLLGGKLTMAALQAKRLFL